LNAFRASGLKQERDERDEGEDPAGKQKTGGVLERFALQMDGESSASERGLVAGVERLRGIDRRHII